MRKSLIFIVLFSILLLGGCSLLSKDANIPGIVYENEDTSVLYLNTNENSEIAMVLVAPNGEGVTAFSETIDGTTRINQMVMRTADGKVGHITLNDLSLPEVFTFEGYTTAFSNYTETTVDLVITSPDGTVETIEKSPLNLPGDVISFLELVMPIAYAQEVSAGMGASASIEDTIPREPLSYAVKTYVNENSLQEEIVEYSKPVIGTCLNILTCSVALTSTFFSAGTTSPLAYIGCGMFVTRMVTTNTEIGECKGDLVQCGADAIMELVGKEGVFGFFKEGLRLKGDTKNIITGTYVTNGTIGLKSKSGKSELRGEWNEEGEYEIYFKEGGIYSVEALSEGYKDDAFDVAISNTQLQVYKTGQEASLTFPLIEDGYQEIIVDLLLEPDAYIRGEVIDHEEAMPIEGAELVLIDETGNVGSDFTRADGEYWIQPPINSGAKAFTIQAIAEGYKNFSRDFVLTYDVMKNSDTYIIENWDGMVRMEPGEEGEEWALTVSLDSGYDSSCEMAGKMLNINKFTIIDGIIEGAQIDPNCTEKCSTYSLGGTVADGKVSMYYAPFGIKNMDFIGSLSGNYASGTFSKINLEKSGESHHFKPCGGTWEAEK